MNMTEQNERFLKLWNSIDIQSIKLTRYEETPIVLDDIQKMELVEVGDRITSPTKLSSFVVIRISGREIITRRNGKTGLRTFKEIVPTNGNPFGFFKLHKRLNS